ncbi:cupin domain-containing protein [Nocardia sp. NPDC059228]|uniref:cupin domain-containing protein n=1 Tax=Nocardia sp. NPDC059228 TaxID=3346777 RepID=UPI00369B50B9
MDNFATYNRPARDGDHLVLALPVPPDLPMPLIAIRDIGRFAALAFDRPDEFLGGFDVGAHWHGHAEEIFYIVDGELDLLAFHPEAEAVGDWLTWQAADGTPVYRGGPGSFMYVPAGCPHAFHNPGTITARMLFMVTPAGHEKYLAELSDLLLSGSATTEAISELRLKHDIHQLTALQNRPT